MKTLTDIAPQLAEPFAIKDVELLPKGSYERDGKTVCMALPYADPRVYQDRLNALVPGEWSTPPPIALTVGDKLVTYVTVVLCGVAHSDVGEAGPGENQGTEAWAQAFKRACSHFGLGRYLYDLEKAWVPFDKQRKRIDLDADGIAAVVWRMYHKGGHAAARASQPHEAAQDNGTSTHQANGQEPASGDTEGQSVALPTPEQLKAQCERIYGPDTWDKAKHKIGIARPDEELSDGDRAKMYQALCYAETKAAQRKQASAA